MHTLVTLHYKLDDWLAEFYYKTDTVFDANFIEE